MKKEEMKQILESELDWDYFISCGYLCEIKRHPDMMHLCGYIYIPNHHPWFGHGDDLDVYVHGGITCSHKDSEFNLWCIGFDCAHSGDYIPSYSFMSDTLRLTQIDDVYRNWEYVKNEVENLAHNASMAMLPDNSDFDVEAIWAKKYLLMENNGGHKRRKV